LIRVEGGAAGPVLIADLPRGSVAYIDADWLPANPGEVPSLVATDGALTWRGGPAVHVPGGLDADTAAIFALLALAQAAVRAKVCDSDSTEVIGKGLVARQVRSLLGKDWQEAARVSSPEKPAAIVDTTGDPSALVDAMRRLVDLGTLVLVGESLGRRAQMNLYADAHLRGLTLVGIPPPLHERRLEVVTGDRDTVVEMSRSLLVPIPSGASLASDAAWFRLSG
jgi:hypothetical protein